MTQVFISYSRRDLPFVEQLARDLKNAGFEVWYDVSGIGGGARWRAAIESAVRSSQFAIVVLSPDSIASEWVEREFLFASNLKRKIIPLYYRECELPLNYLDLNYIDVRGGNYQKNFPEILSALDRPGGSPLPPAPPKRRPGIRAGIAGGVVVLLFLALGAYWLRQRNPPGVEATEPNPLVPASPATDTAAPPAASETPAVFPTSPPAALPPDLFIASLTLDPATPVQGSPLAVRVEVSNGGTGNAEAFVVQWWAGEDDTEPGCAWRVEGLAAGASRELTCDYAGYPRPSADLTTEVTADSAEQVGESDEGNNTRSMGIRVSQGSIIRVVFDSYPDGSVIADNQFLDGDEFLDLGIRLSGAPETSYCAGATATAIRPAGSYVGLDFKFLTTANPAEIDRCNTVLLAILFTDPARRVTLTFAGASVPYILSAYDREDNLLGREHKDGVSRGGTFEVTFASGSADISRVTFGYEKAVTAVKELEYER
jgi:hypothetical protein